MRMKEALQSSKDGATCGYVIARDEIHRFSIKHIIEFYNTYVLFNNIRIKYTF